MVSYPGEILRRFGRYEAVESIGRAGLTDLWRAWDPHLARFVVVAVLQDVDPADVRTRIPNLDAALEHWTGGKYRHASQVLDFEPGREGANPFIVLALAEESPAQRDLVAGPIESRSGVRLRHWDLVAAVGGMLMAGALAWGLWRAFPASVEPPVACPPATTVATADEQREAHAIPTVEERIAASSSTAAAQPLVTAEPTAIVVDRVVQRWLAAYCKDIEDRYEERGREQWRCSWQDVEISGAMQALDVAFTRIDRAVGKGREELEVRVREQIRLTCAADGCRRLAAPPEPGVEITARQAGVVTPTETVPAEVERRNHPPVVEILAAPQRVVPGERVVLESRVTDPDTSVGDEVQCEWSVDGKPLARLCWEFVWPVPTTTKYGNVIFTLKARDRHGASDSKSVSVFVGPSERAIGRLPAAPTRAP